MGRAATGTARMTGRAGRVTLTAEDRRMFGTACRTAGPRELLTVDAFVNDHADRFSRADLRFMRSNIGRRCERLLRNVAANGSWDD